MTESNENTLIERVFLRVGSAETDEQLESVLGRFLTPTLLKLDSTEEGVRKKVMELLVHVNKRLKSRVKVQLPMDDLLTQYADTKLSSIVTNFTIIYIKMGFPRLDSTKQAEKVATLIQSLDGRSTSHQDSLLQLILPALQHIEMPQSMEKRKEKFRVLEDTKLTKLLKDFMLDALIIPYGSHTKALELQAQLRRPATAPPGNGQGNPALTAPPGLSIASFRRIMGDNPYEPEALEKVKLGVVKFLGSDLFPEEDIICHLIIGAADTRHSVATAADMELKKRIGSVDLNNMTLINKLFSLFLGSIEIKGQPMKPDQKRMPACTRIRLKIFPHLLKARESANAFPYNIQALFDCLYGTNTNNKLKVYAVQFIHHMCLSCTDPKFAAVNPVLQTKMIQLVKEGKEDAKVLSLSYVAVGKLVCKFPLSASSNLALVQVFFNKLSQVDPEMRLAVQEALSLMADVFKDLNKTNSIIMESLLMETIDKEEPQARMMAVQYASRVFPQDHAPSRYILLLAAGDSKEDIRIEAMKALHPTKDKSYSQEAAKSVMPGFTEMALYIKEKADIRVTSHNKYVTGNNTLPFNPAGFSEILLYLRACLARSAGVAEPDLENVGAMKDQAPLIAGYMGKLLGESKPGTGPVYVYVTLVQQLLKASGGAVPMYCLLEVVAMAREQLVPQFVDQLGWIKTYVFSMKDDIRELAANLYAVVVCNQGDEGRILEVLDDCYASLSDKTIEVQHGAMLALGYMIGMVLRKKEAGEVKQAGTHWQKVEKRMETAVLAIAKLVKVTDESSPLLSAGACQAMGEMGRCCALPLPPGEEGASTEGEITKLSVVNNLLAIIKSGKENIKSKERAAMCLGQLCVGERQFPHRRAVIQGLLDSVQGKQIELHFTIGEALVYAAQGPTSPAARDLWTQTQEQYQSMCEATGDEMGWYVSTVLEKYVSSVNPNLRQASSIWLLALVKCRGSMCEASGDEVGWYVSTVLEKYVSSVNPHLRQASSIWLLALVKRCGVHPEIQERLAKLQEAFMTLLSESDDLTQDIASKGLGLVYEICSQAQKDQLVSLLVDTLTTGKHKQRTVTGDTQVFEEGSLGKTPEGSSMSTYKELCSIANEMNQPDLIYKFMHLANHNAMWNSRKGAAFGFSSIAAQAGEQLAPYLPQIVPRLYRYQFDPNPKIQQAMSSIWNALVQDNKNTVDKYMNEILNDLLSNLTNPQWRVRESSCLAVNDLLRGRALDDVVESLPELWETCLRVLDDIKESVRKAADLACKCLSRASIKICDVSYGKVGERATFLVLPTLLKCGLQSPVPEVRAIGLSTLLKISKNAGKLIRPHLAVLVVALLEAISGLEPQVMNYLSLHTASDRDTQNRLDSARIAASKMSPMMETVNLCVQYIDDTVLPELIPRFTELVKSGLGVGTKAACSNFVISLVHHCSKDLTDYAGKLMAAFMHGLADRNASVRKSYALALGHLVRIAKDSSVEKLIIKMKSWYLEKEDEAAHNGCGLTLHALSQQSPDILRRHATVVMPLTFLAMHEVVSEEKKDSDSLSMWEEVWLEITPGTEAGIRLYLTEIADLLQETLQSQSWTTKAQAAAAMATVAEKMGSNLGPPHLTTLTAALLQGLQGRTWAGKESLLKAVQCVCTSCGEQLKEESEKDTDYVSQILEALLRESKKEKLEYKLKALECFGEVLETFEIDRFTDIFNILAPVLNKEEKMDVDGEEKEELSSELKQRQLVCHYTVLGQAWPNTLNTQDEFSERVGCILCETLQSNTWKIQEAILKSTQKFIKRLLRLKEANLLVEKEANMVKLLQLILTTVSPCLGNLKYTVIRNESLAVVECLVTKLSDVDKLTCIPEPVLVKLQQDLEAMATDNSPELQDRAAKCLKMTR